MWKNGLIRMLRIVSKFITSQTGKQIITIYLLSNISRRKDNQVMKFGQLKEYNTRNIFLQKSWREWGRETSSGHLFSFLKTFHIMQKQVFSILVLIYFGRPRLKYTIKKNCATFQVVDPELWSILIFYKRVWD